MLQCLNEKGITLVEMLVVIGIFSLIAGAISGPFLSGISSQRKILANQEILDQTSYVLEYMSRALRMAKKDQNGTCIPAKTNYQKLANGIKFLNYNNECQQFYLEQSQLKENKAGTILPLTSNLIKVRSFRIQLSGETQTDNLQPRVTIFLEVEGRGKNPPKIQIQTTISQRNLDVQY